MSLEHTEGKLAYMKMFDSIITRELQIKIGNYYTPHRTATFKILTTPVTSSVERQEYKTVQQLDNLLRKLNTLLP